MREERSVSPGNELPQRLVHLEFLALDTGRYKQM